MKNRLVNPFNMTSILLYIQINQQENMKIFVQSISDASDNAKEQY